MIVTARFVGSDPDSLHRGRGTACLGPLALVCESRAQLFDDGFGGWFGAHYANIRTTTTVPYTVVTSYEMHPTRKLELVYRDLEGGQVGLSFKVHRRQWEFATALKELIDNAQVMTGAHSDA